MTKCNAKCKMLNAKYNAKCKMLNAKYNAKCKMLNAYRAFELREPVVKARLGVAFHDEP